MTKAVFEASALADVIRRAGAVAPTRGEALDKAAGIILYIDTQNKTCTVMATDLAVWYMENLSVLECSGENKFWRVPSQVFTATITKFPIGNGKTVNFTDEETLGRLDARAGRGRASFNTLSAQDYPMWDAVTPGDLVTVQDFGKKLKQVMWAMDGMKNQQLHGVGFGSGWIGCTDRFRIARQDTGFTPEAMFMVPAKILASVVPEFGDVQIGRVGNMFLCVPNPYTQIKTVLASQFMPLDKVLNQTWECAATFSKTEIMPILTQITDFVLGDRLGGRMSMYVGASEIAVFLDNQQVGLYGNVVDAAGSPETHARLKIELNPINLKDAVSAFPGEVVTMKYNFSTENKTLCFTNDLGYISVIAPMAPPPAPEEQEKTS